MSVTPVACGASHTSPNKGGAMDTPCKTHGLSGGGGGITNASGTMRTCCNCNEDVPSSECCPWSKTSYSCHTCKTNYNRCLERQKGDQALKAWWKNLSKDDKIAWFRRNKETYEPNRKHCFDNAGEYSQSHNKADLKQDIALVHHITEDEWILRQMQLGFLGEGSKSEQYRLGKQRFKDLIGDRTVEKVFENGQWLVAMYRGKRSLVGVEERQSQEWKRKRTIDDSVDHIAALELSKAASEASEVWRSRVERSLFANVQPGLDATQVLEGLARCPETVAHPRADAPDEIRREVLLSMQRAGKIADLEEMDDHEAAQGG